MLRRLLPTLVALGCGLLALGWGLVSLQRIFSRERDEAHAQLRSRRDALAHAGAEALRQELARKLDADIPAIHAAMGDPLEPGEGFYFNFRGAQFLPRLTIPRPGGATSARDTHARLGARLKDGAAAGDWEPRLSRLRAVEAALAAGDAAGVAPGVEELLRYHAAHALPPEEELPFLLLVVERLQRGDGTPPLVRALLREGLPEDFGGFARASGLQRDLLRERSRFTQADFHFLHARVVQVSAALGEPTADLLARASEAGAGMLVIPEDLVEPTLLGQFWYVAPRGEAVYGIAVDLEAMLQPITRDMQARGLFDATGRLRLNAAGAFQPLRTLTLAVDMPAWARQEADIDARHGLKTLLVAVCGALAVAIVALAVVSQQRKYRFLELKSDFVATVSHELRTPLASIRLLGETLERKLAQAPEVRDYPARIVQAADGLHFLVENILSFNRIDKGRWTLRTSRVRLEELVPLLRDELETATSVPVHLTADLEGAELEADPGLLRLLFSNLGRNACAYNRSNPVEIDISAQVIPGYGCTVLFRDNGIGIPESEWEHAFQDFYRVTSAGPEVHGSGLGLALCRRIMKLHRGDIQVAASGPDGTTFALIFNEPPR
ncbi:Phosphate regulon sensor protein PhoR (SphS) [Myxococcus hansupus]|uniref:histidine kinase n=1 Tax=Pseudomyxococcus hansupus TaxID=1297742 RepID=A0A0H4WX07_9BACT|nr:HAMP domain-containing sensor histidine kinase [Myxococcus hansupus]AKQ67344.1 Phosphate regulon sensor protein PhoR (SphS) [Myxococcus hansupus]